MGRKKPAPCGKPVSSGTRSFLLRVNCFYRTNVSARAAVSAYIGIDLIDVTFCNSINRALIYAGATGSAIVSDYVSHLFMVLVNTRTI